jgi:hypothetical protein
MYYLGNSKEFSAKGSLRTAIIAWRLTFAVGYLPKNEITCPIELLLFHKLEIVNTMRLVFQIFNYY